MTTRHLLPIALVLPVALAGLIATGSQISGALAQPTGGASTPQTSPAHPAFSLPSLLTPRLGKPGARSSEARSSDPPPMTFFIAAGPVNACGSGCDGWIAAEGKIDLNAAQRLRKLLAKLGPRKLPLFLHSAGGSVLGAIELGRLVRSHHLTVSVARTFPAACQHDNPQNQACEAVKRSGQDLVAELDTSGAMCNSACVLVLAGGAHRTVPPWVRLGVHAIGVDTSKTSIRGAVLAAVTRSANARIVEFLHDMGIPKALFDASNAIPHESSRFLERDELERFELDTREFGETDWRFSERPTAAMTKGFFMHTGDADLAYPEALVRLNCGAGQSMRLTIARERPASTLGAGVQPVHLTVNGTHFDVPYSTRAGRIELHATTLWPDVIASAGDNATIEISGLVPAGGKMAGDKTPDGGASHDQIVLGMAGFSSAYAKLHKVCTETASALNGCSPGDPSPRCMPDAVKNRPPTPALARGQAAWPTP